jgi:hypothetical protein
MLFAWSRCPLPRNNRPLTGSRRGYAAAGGNKWASITESLVLLRTAIEAGDDEAIEVLVEKLRTARHNTGALQEKLKRLDAYLRSRQGPALARGSCKG